MILVRKAQGLVTVQDLGRPGHASQAVPRGGALSLRRLRDANMAVGNPEDAACIEIMGRLVIETDAAVDVATESGELTTLRPGAEIILEPGPNLRARYVAMGGGLDAPRVLGSASTLVGCFGRALQAGDRLGVGTATRRQARGPTRARDVSPFRVVAGPDDRASFEKLVETSWRVDPASDRRGTRLVSVAGSQPKALADVMPSSPTVPGAIQLPSGGGPIVVGPDGPTTGGYPLVAVITREDLDRFHELPLGATLAFVAA